VTVPAAALLVILASQPATPESRVTLRVQGRSVSLSDEQQSDLSRRVERLITGCSINSVTSPDIFSTRSLDKEWEENLAGSRLHLRLSEPLRSRHGGVQISEVLVGLGSPTFIGPELSKHAGQVTGYVKCDGHRSLALMCGPSIRRHLLPGQEKACEAYDRLGEPRDPTPRITPIYSRLVDGPSFLVVCPNTTVAAIPAGTYMGNALRLDGKEEKPSGMVGSLLGGPPDPIEPGKDWIEILSLAQSNKPTWSATFGANIRDTRPLSLTRGRHRLAVQCGREWSPEIEFYWEPGPPNEK
jgi:hypothetical protein